MSPWNDPRIDRQGTVTGQALAEFALVFPILMLVLFAAIVIGMFIFFQAQVTNAAREGARYAAVHSATAQCPTVSWRDPNPAALQVGTYARCDRPPDWPLMAAWARSKIWGIPSGAVGIAACWAGYGVPPNYDLPPTDPATGLPNGFAPCTIAGLDPVNDTDSLACPATTTLADDTASDLHENTVTVYACFAWQPPLGGVLFLPSTMTIRAVVTEVIQRQQ